MRVITICIKVCFSEKYWEYLYVKLKVFDGYRAHFAFAVIFSAFFAQKLYFANDKNTNYQTLKFAHKHHNRIFQLS